MATAKRSTASGRKSPATRSRTTSAQAAGASKTTKRAQSAKPASAPGASKKAAANGTKQNRTASSRAAAGSKNGSSGSRGAANRKTAGSQNGSAGRRASTRARTPETTHDGVMESVKHAGGSALRVANRASGPTVTVAAAVAGIAGGLLLRQRPSPGVRDGLGARSRHLLHDVDPAAVIEGLGRASMLVSRRSKSLARDIDQVAERAERLSKVLR